MSDSAEEAISTRTIRCLECGRLWVEPSERWRTYLSSEDQPRPLTYCPHCARREFG